jgi:hypothetical protein
VEEADMILDPPPGGWGELVTRDWLQLVLDARFAAIERSIDARFALVEPRFVSIEEKLVAIEGRLVSMGSRLTSIDTDLRAQTWKLVGAMVGFLTVLVAAIKL